VTSPSEVWNFELSRVEASIVLPWASVTPVKIVPAAMGAVPVDVTIVVDVWP